MPRPLAFDHPLDIAVEMGRLWDEDEWWLDETYYYECESTWCSCGRCRMAAYFTEGETQHTGHGTLRFSPFVTPALAGHTLP